MIKLHVAKGNCTLCPPPYPPPFYHQTILHITRIWIQKKIVTKKNYPLKHTSLWSLVSRKEITENKREPSPALTFNYNYLLQLHTINIRASSLSKWRPRPIHWLSPKLISFCYQSLLWSQKNHEKSFCCLKETLISVGCFIYCFGSQY